MKKTFKIDDLILAGLNLPDPCPVRIKIEHSRIHLYIGPRDWAWDFHTQELTGCGTDLIENKD